MEGVHITSSSSDSGLVRREYIAGLGRQARRDHVASTHHPSARLEWRGGRGGGRGVLGVRREGGRFLHQTSSSSFQT